MNGKKSLEDTHHKRCYACFGVVGTDRMILRINFSFVTITRIDNCNGDAPPRIIELLLL
jgi:hypothetical protein